MISKKGFTLFEILIVITIMAIISIAAFTTSINTQRQFVFINTFKELLAKVREARLYNVTQKSVDLNGSGSGTEPGVPSSYGIYIQNDGSKIIVTIFGDLADIGTKNAWDSGEEIGNIYYLDKTKYNLLLKDSNGLTLADLEAADSSLTLLYPPGEIKVTGSYKSEGTTAIITSPYIYLELKDEKLDIAKNIFIFLRSGIAEEYQVPTPSP